MATFTIFDQTTSEAKICSRNDLKMVGTSFESWESIFFEKIIFIKILYFFVPFWNQNGMIHFSFLMIPFWFQKGTKKCKIFMKFIFLENMDSQLSIDVPTMFRSYLEHILACDVVWSKSAKITIFAIFAQNSSNYLGT